jgi:DNA polymerase
MFKIVAMNKHSKYHYLNAMGIPVWQRRNLVPTSVEVKTQGNIIEASASPQMSREREIATLDWDALRAKVAQCTACGLDKSRTQTVFGVGKRQAELLLVGEAPGANEDKQGEPFVGRAGQLLNAMLKAIGLQREQVYIANILKCRPPNNRDPQPHEVACCTPFLQRQIVLLQPKLIVALGRIAAHYLLNTTTTLGKLRGQTFAYGEQRTPLLVTYHPAYLLRSPSEKRKAYQDLCLVHKLLQR